MYSNTEFLFTMAHINKSTSESVYSIYQNIIESSVKGTLKNCNCLATNIHVTSKCNFSRLYVKYLYNIISENIMN